MFIDINGRQFFTLDVGKGPRTFLAHSAWVGTLEDWLPVMEVLSRSWRAVAYDHRGAGLTAARPEEITVEVLVDDIFNVMDALEIDRCILGGFSNCSPVTVLAALQHPERFEGLVLQASHIFPYTAEDVAKSSAWIRRDFSDYAKNFMEWCTPEENVEHIRRWGYHLLTRAEPENAVRLMEFRDGLDVRPLLSRLELPTLVIHGSEDMIPLEEARWVAEQIPDSELVVMEGTGHLPAMIRGPEVAQAIMRRFGSGAPSLGFDAAEGSRFQ